ncbi:ACP S-malonyltransferase [Carboxydocella sp. ULO1]|uniref:ACP S-malonyltransferase n=1 Tax=Carboxydocella sp. ULO1 TaxID=1926599 RepID=UPI0009ACF465|nr:ACP S-malonyltransferase [Carboxydocella sp. ULO1]GAW28408.1 malonyl CoA-acyl carrier protein transacylase [Carboxydocella sp. ULO1]
MKLAFVFPGQGSQYVGMGKNLAETYPEAAAVFQEADAVLGFKLSELCFNGPETELVRTANTQPALLTVSVAALRVLAKAGIQPAMVAGHSLGEYSALVAAEVLSFADALRLVRRRGELMQEAAPPGTAGMAAILGLEREQVVAVCREAETLGVVEPANFNCPGQIVIAGEKAALEKAMELAKARGAKRVVTLNVSGPFHSSLMLPAARGLAPALDEVEFYPPQVPVVVNVSGRILTDPKMLKQSLLLQVQKSVLWEDCIQTMVAAGVDTFIEVGAGKVLSGLIKQINKGVRVFAVEDAESFQRTLAELREVG